MSHWCIFVTRILRAVHTNHKCEICTIHQADRVRSHNLYIDSLPLGLLEALEFS